MNQRIFRTLSHSFVLVGFSIFPSALQAQFKCEVKVNGAVILSVTASSREDCYKQTSFGSANCVKYAAYFKPGMNLLEQFFDSIDRVNSDYCQGLPPPQCYVEDACEATEPNLCTDLTYTLANQQHKYAYYRGRLSCDFLYPCRREDCEGCSMPANERHLWQGDILNWGDETISLGWYIAVLATEYRLKSDAQQDTSRTVEDLYYAIQAFNRLDRTAETYFGGSPALNGFFIRCDVAGNLIAVTQPHFNSLVFSKFPVAQVSSCRNAFDFNTSQWIEKVPTEMSHDQVWHLFMGFALVSKLVPDSVTYNNVSLANESREIVRRVIEYIRRLKFVEGPNNVLVDTPIGKVRIRLGPWLVTNPVTGGCVTFSRPNHTCDEGGAVALPLSYGAAEAACKIVYGFKRGFSFCDFHDAVSLGLGLDIWKGTRLAKIGKEEFKVEVLAAIGDSWGKETSEKLARRSSSKHHEILSLVHTVLYGERSKVPREVFNCLINTAPCKGPYNHRQGNFPHFDWSSSNRFSSGALGVEKPHFDGEYNGLDYMLLHNLYRLAYGTEFGNQHAERCDCFTSKPICKSICREQRRECKEVCKEEKETCFDSCDGKKGKAKRKCKRECRKARRECRRECRQDARECRTECKKGTGRCR